MNKRLNFTVILLILFCFILTPLTAAQDGFFPAQVKDISDRAYEPAVTGLLDNAKDSITISMFILKPSANPGHTINRLIKNLEEALERGVEVTLYLNAKSDQSGFSTHGIDSTDVFDALRQKGAHVCLVTPRYMLHDKMIIVDNRYVVVGSTNWSISALNDNLESTVLIDSPLLAAARLKRMETIHLKGEDLRDPPQISIKKIYPLPELIELPRALMEDKRYFPAMVSTHDNRAMDLYLLVIAESHRRNSKEFYISLEKTAGKLNLPKDWDATALRTQVIKSLKKLKNRYTLIDVQFKHARAAKVKLFALSGETFPIKREFFAPEHLSTKRQNRKFVLLIKAYLEEEEKDINDFSNSELGRMFYVGRTTITEGLR